MRSLIIRLIVALLAFLVGISAHTVWEKRRPIFDSCAEFILNWED